MTLTMKRKAVKDQPPKKPLMPLAMQRDNFHGTPGPELRESMRDALRNTVAKRLASTTTPAGIVANDPDAATEKASGKRLIEMSDAELRRKCDGVSPESGEALASLVATRFTLGLFQRHPDNRQPAAAEVTALAADMKVNQQREPILARKLAGDKLQVLWGEKRWLAAKEAELPYLWARVTECNDTRALELVAQGNAQRSDFNPIEKARLIEKLCQAGKTREAAAADVGLESGSAATNLVRLLKLPKAWQDRVAAGDLPESYARMITPYVHLSGVMKELEDEWKHDGSENEWAFESRSTLDHTLDGIARGCLCRLDETKWYYGYDAGFQSGDYKCLIDLTPEVRKKLGVTTLEIAEDGKQQTVEVATNIKLFKKLQEEAIKALQQEKAKKQAKSAGKKVDAGEKEKPKTKAEIERARKVRAEQLERSIGEWKERIVRREIAAAIRKAKPGDMKVQKLVVSCLFDPPPEPHYNEPSFRDMLEGLLGLGKGKTRSVGEYQAIHEFAPSGNLLYGLAAEFVAAAIGGTADGPSHYLWQQTLKKLHALGFFAVRDGNKKGTYKIAALDPFAALEGLRLNGKKDPQTVLGFADQITPLPPYSEADRSGLAGVLGSGLTPGCGGDRKEDPPEEVPEVPPEDPRRPFRSSEKELIQSPSLIFGRSSASSQKLASREDTEDGRRGSSGTSSATREAADIADLQRLIAARQAELNPSRPEKPMQDQMAATVTRLPSPEQQTAAAEQRATLIYQAVDCPSMRMAPCVRMAWHVVEGRVVWSKLATLFKALNDCEREGRLTVPRSVYANKGFDRICRECGVDLPPRKSKPR